MLPLIPCIHRGMILGDKCECRSNRVNHMIPGIAPLVLYSACPYADVLELDEFPCQHRGAVVRREKCDLCGSRDVRVDVLACGVFGECTVHAHGLTAGRSGPKLVVCFGCDRRTQEGAT